MSELLNNNDNILSNFPPCLRKNIGELCLRSTIGLLPISLEDISITANSYTTEDNILNNFHFIIKVPYAGKKLKWEIIFDPEDFYFAPDFEFNDNEFLNCPDIDILFENVPSWKNWDIKNPKILAQVLNEFLILYKKQQIDKLHMENIYSRYSKEYQTLISEKEGLEEENVQVSVEGSSIVFLMSLKIDCSSLPEYVHPVLYKGNNLSEHTLYNQGNDFCHLKVSVLKLDGSHFNHSIQLSPRLEQVLGNFKFSAASFKKDTSLIDKVSSLSRLLKNKLEKIADHYKLKKLYIMKIAAACSKTIIEYDVLTFNRAVFIYGINDYNCLVTITIGPKFPQEKPTVVLTSVYCQESKDCSKILDNYPYNFGFKPEDNIKNLLEHLHDIVQDFKEHKH